MEQLMSVTAVVTTMWWCCGVWGRLQRGRCTRIDVEVGGGGVLRGVFTYFVALRVTPSSNEIRADVSREMIANRKTTSIL